MAAYHRVYDYITCGLMSFGPMLVIEYGITLLFTFIPTASIGYSDKRYVKAHAERCS